MLADKIKHYQETGEALSVTPAKYKNQYEWLKEVDSLALSNAQLNLQMAYRNFFRQTRTGFSKFKSKKNSRKRYTTNNHHGSIRIVGYVKVIQHSPMMGVIKSVTVEQTPTNKYFVSILVEYESQISENMRAMSRQLRFGTEVDKWYASNQRCNYVDTATRQ